MKRWTLAELLFLFSLAALIANPNASVQAYQPELLTAGRALAQAT